MTLNTQVSTKEVIRVGDAAYASKTVNVMLCSIGVTGYTAETTVADWQANAEISGNGYSMYTEALSAAPAGVYNTSTGQYEIPVITAVFTAAGGSLTYDRLVIYITGETYVHSVLTENPEITLVDGQTQTYKIYLSTDD